jgi:hydroxymethylpyrimidine pyrophosphatase-like HAD family hydrolase
MIPFKSKRRKTWFIDLDGTILRYNLLKSAFCKDELLPGVKELWDRIPKKDHIVLVTARPKYLKKHTIRFLEKNGIRFDDIIFNLPNGERILINDDKPNGTNMSFVWRVKRNEGFLNNFTLIER